MYPVRYFYGLLIGKSINIISVRFTTEDNKVTLSDGSIVFPEVEVYEYLNQQMEFDFDFKSEPLFHHTEVKKIFGTLICNYFRFHSEYRICYELFFSSFYNNNEFIHTRFLNYLHGLETLHSIFFPDHTELSEDKFKDFLKKIESTKLSEEERKMLNLEHINGVSLSKRLSHIIDNYEELKRLFENSKAIKSFIFKVVKTRNYYTHHDERIKNEILQDTELFNATNKLQLILHFYLLTIIGLKPNNLEIIFRRYIDYQTMFIR